MSKGKAAAGVIAGLGLCGCAADVTTVASSYDALTRELVRIDVDTNRDGVVDTRTYMRGTVAYRTEVDGNGDGRVDRWEYLENGELRRVGSSSANDGVEDTWAAVAAVDGERRVTARCCAIVAPPAMNSIVARSWCAPRKTPMATA